MDNGETRSVIITGGAHGIGAACADRLASDGRAVVIADFDGAGAEKKAQELAGNGARALGVRADISSEDGTALKGSASRIHYVSSKGAILSFTKTLALEVGAKGVRVNCVAPGSTLSEEAPDEAMVEYRKSRAKDRAIPRLQVPADLAGAVSFFLSLTATSSRARPWWSTAA